MGYISHSAIIVTLGDWMGGLEEFKETFNLLRETPLKFDGTAARYMPEPTKGINGYYTFFVAPDGSKEGWDESNEMDKVREKVKIAAQKIPYADIVTLRFGGDDHNRLDAEICEYEEVNDGDA